MIRIRGLCAALAPEIKYYMFVDDDFRFSGPTPSMPFTSGQRYLQVIDYLERMPYCGVVNVKGFLGLLVGAHSLETCTTSMGFLCTLKSA